MLHFKLIWCKNIKFALKYILYLLQFSMTWVILGHTFYFAIPQLDNPKVALEYAENSFAFQSVLQVRKYTEVIK
jgi:hypothetical protein